MAAIDEYIEQIQDVELRRKISKAVDDLKNQKKFGLVFEEHLPECTPLYDVPVRRGSKVAMKQGKVNEIYRVIRIEGAIAICVRKGDTEQKEIPVAELVSVAEFGEAIYPSLQPIDMVCNAPDSPLWHALIEADNYHALQLLKYLYAGKVDCIYIDPPYNTGAKDWKYNNDYVDGVDEYRHSKWLSMMKKRLDLARDLLNPNDSVLIVTIDEKEYLHLGCLLEEMFSSATIQMVSSVISHHGAIRTNEFSRVNEFIFFVMIGNYSIVPFEDAGYVLEGEPIHWQSYRRSSPSNIRPSRPSQFYPIYVEKNTGRIVEIGEPITPDVDRFSVKEVEGCETVFPVRDDGTEMMWSWLPSVCRKNLAKGYIKAGKYSPNKPQQYSIQYLMSGTIKDIETGKIAVTGYNDDGSIIAENVETKKILPKSQWDNKLHDARDYGTKILRSTIGELRFNFPKSLYAVHDCIRYFVSHKKDALIIDFFSGSGTTLHAVNLLNAEDGGHRRCIMVTNNEVSIEEAKELSMKGYHPGDAEWEKFGIARYVTWPRTVCSIEGHDVNGNPLKGNYIGSNNSMAEGFKANAVFFKLGFLDKNEVALGKQFKELLPILWMKSGAYGTCPSVEENTPDMMVLPENRFAVLVNEKRYMEFVDQVDCCSEINTIFIVTDSEHGFRDMILPFEGKETFQLYRDYLDNFRINVARR